MTENKNPRYNPPTHGFMYGTNHGNDLENFTSSITLPKILPSGEKMMCVTDYNLIIPYVMLSLANRLERRFASLDYRIQNYRTIKPNKEIDYSLSYTQEENSEAKISIMFFDNRILAAKFCGIVKVK